jgi:uncharacterized RDD family membrane protein YckC
VSVSQGIEEHPAAGLDPVPTVEGLQHTQVVAAACAPFWTRLAAVAIDAVLLNLPLNAFALGMTRQLERSYHGHGLPPTIWWTWNLSWGAFQLLVYWLYFTLLNGSSKHATVGKQQMHLTVVDERGTGISAKRARGRSLASIVPMALVQIIALLFLYYSVLHLRTTEIRALSFFFPLLWLLSIAFTRTKRAPQDMIAHNYVLRKRK